MKRILACRPGCYDLPLPDALRALKSAGIDHAEVNAPVDGDYDGVARAAAEAGVTVSTLGAGVVLDDPARVADLGRTIAGAARIGVPIVFVSVAVKTMTPEQGIGVLRELAEEAHRAGVVLSMETHMPYGHNAETACRTLEAVRSAGLGFNYDTANIYYYNPKGIDAVGELRKALPWISSVHLKESARGEPGAFEFPVLGQGVVDFPAVFRILDARGFAGPYTLELEGPLVAGLPTEERTGRVRACLDYLRRIGVMD